MGAPPQAAPPVALDRLLQQEQAFIARRVLNELDSDRDRQILFRFYIAEDDKERICRESRAHAAALQPGAVQGPRAVSGPVSPVDGGARRRGAAMIAGLDAL